MSRANIPPTHNAGVPGGFPKATTLGHPSYLRVLHYNRVSCKEGPRRRAPDPGTEEQGR